MMLDLFGPLSAYLGSLGALVYLFWAPLVAFVRSFQVFQIPVHFNLHPVVPLSTYFGSLWALVHLSWVL